MTIHNHYLLINFFLIPVFLGISSCTHSLNKKNYLMCLEKLEIDRQKVREDGGYSYKGQTFEECRSPVRYRINSD